jgi:hypothetical protein
LASAAVATIERRPLATYRDDLTTMLIAFWPIKAMFFDGRNHDNHTGQEAFFTPTHGVLDVGLTVLGLWIGTVLARYQAIPVGYGVAAPGSSRCT